MRNMSIITTAATVGLALALPPAERGFAAGAGPFDGAWSVEVDCPDVGDVSDCLSGQAIFHGDLVRTIALRIVRSWRRQAMMATFFGLPRLTRRW